MTTPETRNYSRGEQGEVIRREWGKEERHPAFDAYWQQYRNLVWWAARKARKVFGGELGDYVGYLTLRLNRALYSYDPERGYAFTTYYCANLLSDILKMVLRYESDGWALTFVKHSTSKREMVKLHNTARMESHLFFRPPDCMVQDDTDEILKCFNTPEDLYRFLCKGLDSRDAEMLWWRYARDETLDQIAAHYGGISRERVRQITNRALDHVKKRVGSLDRWVKLWKVQDCEMEDMRFPDHDFEGQGMFSCKDTEVDP